MSHQTPYPSSGLKRAVSKVFSMTCVLAMGLQAADETLDVRTPSADAKQRRTYIPHSLELPAFSPPAPAVEKSIPSIRVDSAITVPTKSARTLTIIRGEASTLPDLPEPPVLAPHGARQLTPDEIEQAKIWRRRQLNLGATIYDHRYSQIRWNHPDTGEAYEVICGFDLGLVAGIGGFLHNGESYTLMLIHSNIDTTRIRKWSRNWMPNFPEILADSITVVKGNPNDAVGMNAFNVVRDIIASEKSRLIPYQAARRQFQLKATEWEKAHPILPRDETIWFKPHRGSRYLTNPKPETSSK